MKKEMSAMTMAEIRTELDATVESYNARTNSADGVKLEVKARDLVADYNKAALVAAYSRLIKEENPVMSIVKEHFYATLSVKFSVVDDTTKDGKVIAVKVASIENTTKYYDLFDFLDWAGKRNKKLTADPLYKGKVVDAQEKLNKRFSAMMQAEKTCTISKTLVNDALQSVFDSILFIAGEKGNNAIHPTKDGINIVIVTAADLKKNIEDGKVKFNLSFLSSRKWKSIIFDALHLAVTGKKVEYVYGDPAKKQDAKDDVKTDTESES